MPNDLPIQPEPVATSSFNVADLATLPSRLDRIEKRLEKWLLAERMEPAFTTKTPLHNYGDGAPLDHYPTNRFMPHRRQPHHQPHPPTHRSPYAPPTTHGSPYAPPPVPYPNQQYHPMRSKNPWEAVFDITTQRQYQPITSEGEIRTDGAVRDHPANRHPVLQQTSTVAVYIQEFEDFSIRSPDLSAHNLLNRFMAGLKEEIHREIILFRPQTLQAAMGIARVAEQKLITAKGGMFRTALHRPPWQSLRQPIHSDNKPPTQSGKDDRQPSPSPSNSILKNQLITLPLPPHMTAPAWNKMEVLQPAATMLVELSKSQDVVAGDGFNNEGSGRVLEKQNMSANVVFADSGGNDNKLVEAYLELDGAVKGFRVIDSTDTEDREMKDVVPKKPRDCGRFSDVIDDIGLPTQSIHREDDLEGPLGLSAPSTKERVVVMGIAKRKVLSIGVPVNNREKLTDQHSSEISQSRRPKFGSSKAKESLIESEVEALKEATSLQEVFPIASLVTATNVFLCAHGSRDKRCGVCGPVLLKKLKEGIGTRDLQEKGSYQSIHPTQMGLTLNIDVSARAFYEPILVTDFIARYCIRDIRKPLTDRDRIKVEKALKGLKVTFTHREQTRSYKVSGITSQTTCQLVFPMGGTGTQTSLVQYYRGRYNIKLQYVWLPCIQAGNDKRRVDRPMEICKMVEGQRFSKNLNEKQFTNLLRATCQRPVDREKTIKEMGAQSHFSDDFVEDFVGFATVENGTCVSLAKLHEDAIHRFCHLLIEMCCKRRMVFDKRPVIPVQSAHPGHIERIFTDIHKHSSARKRHLQLLLIILPETTGSYPTIKRVCETKLGIVSQCCQPGQALKCNYQYMENVTMKINGKVSGRNIVLVDVLSRRIPLVNNAQKVLDEITGREVPVASMETGGKFVGAQHNEFQTVNKYLGASFEVTDGERFPLAINKLGTCDLYPLSLKHNPNGRLVVVGGDEEYVIYTAVARRNRFSGSALDFIGSSEGEHAVREITPKIKIFNYSAEEQGVEDAFELLHEINKGVRTGLWVGDCFIYSNSSWSLNYCVGGKVTTMFHLDRPMSLFGFLASQSRVYLIDKEFNVMGCTLLLSLIEYKTKVMRGDLEHALEVATDYIFELAINLGKLEIAKAIATTVQSEIKWKRLGELAVSTEKLDLAEQCLECATDLTGLLLLYSSQGEARGSYPPAHEYLNTTGTFPAFYLEVEVIVDGGSIDTEQRSGRPHQSRARGGRPHQSRAKGQKRLQQSRRRGRGRTRVQVQSTLGRRYRLRTPEPRATGSNRPSIQHLPTPAKLIDHTIYTLIRLDHVASMLLTEPHGKNTLSNTININVMYLES